MKLEFKDNFLGYFQFYYRELGIKMFIYLTMSIFISFLDGLSLAMFIPLLNSVGDKGESGEESLGKLTYLTHALRDLGIELNITNVLLVIISIFLIKGALRFLQLNYAKALRFTFIKNLRFKLVDSLQNLSYRGFLELDSGKIQNTLTGEVQRVVQSMTSYFNAAQASVMLLSYVFLAFLANFQFAILVGVGAAVSNLLYRRIYIQTKRASLHLSKTAANFNSYLIQAIHHFKYLKSTNYFSKYSLKLKDVITDTEVLNKKMGFNNAILGSVKEPMIMIIVSLVILFEVNVMAANLTSILLSLMLFYRALTYLMSVQNFWQTFIQNIGGMNSVANMLHEMDLKKEDILPKPSSTLTLGLQLKEINFAYGSHKILDDININIRKNETIALVGESGSGKTTLANIIAGLIHPDTGQLLVDQQPLLEVDLNHYRDKIGYISQDAVIFNDHIFNNITFWDEPTPENKERFWEIIELTSLTNFVSTQENKEFTKLGDNGILISGGQKQRISIARELYKKAEILILDEATSALDSETEKYIQDNIDKLHGSYTMIIIAHRLSTIKKADAIYLLNKGQVMSSGSFSEMMENSPKFQRMVSLQEF